MQLVKFFRNNMVDVSLYTRRKLLIGTSRSFVHPDFTTLANINVRESFQQEGYGSILLHETERYLQDNFNVSKISLLAKQIAGGDELIRFYIKNGYQISDDDIAIFDDYSHIYDLIRMHKLL